MLAIKEDNAGEEGPTRGEGQKEASEVEGGLFGEEGPEDLGAGDAGGGYSDEVGDGTEEEGRPAIHVGCGNLAGEASGAQGGEESEEEEREDGRGVGGGGACLSVCGWEDFVRGRRGVEAGKGMEGAHGLPS